MIFVVNSDFASASLRGIMVAEEIKCPCYFSDLDGVCDQDVVFVKDADRGLVEDAKDRGNRVIYDPLDLYAYKDRTAAFEDLVDVLIIQNRKSIEFYAPRFVNAKFAVIPHQWDPRIKRNAPQDSCRTGYIGKGFNLTVHGWDGAQVCHSSDFLHSAPLFNLHISLNQRDPKHILLKPQTKIVTAAAVGANVVSYDDPGAVELLGADYPYLVKEPAHALAAIKAAQDSFGSETWKRARAKMLEIRKSHSLSAIANLYKQIEQGILETA